MLIFLVLIAFSFCYLMVVYYSLIVCGCLFCIWFRLYVVLALLCLCWLLFEFNCGLLLAFILFDLGCVNFVCIDCVWVC